jgi:hypothetical protein
VFPAGPANFIFCSAQYVPSLIFVHESIIARFRLLGLPGRLTLMSWTGRRALLRDVVMADYPGPAAGAAGDGRYRCVIVVQALGIEKVGQPQLHVD